MTAEDVRGWLDRDGLDACALHAPLVTVEADLRAPRGDRRGRSGRPARRELGRPADARPPRLADIRDRLAAAAPAAAALGLAARLPQPRRRAPPLRRRAGLAGAAARRDAGAVPRARPRLGVVRRLRPGRARRACRRTAAPIVHIKDFRPSDDPRTARSATARSGTTSSPRRPSPRASTGCSSSRTRSTARARRGRPLPRRADDVRRRGRVIGAARIGSSAAV